MIDARVVIDAARDPTRDDDPFLKIQPPAPPPPPPPRSVSFAIAGARGVGKTAFVRRFFSESRRTVVGHTDDDDDDDRSSSWRSTPTIGMDYGAVTLAPPMTTTPRVRFRFYDPSGAVAHAACRAEAFRAAEAIVVVVDPDVQRVDDDDDARGAIEEMIDEIVRAREGASDDDDEDARVGGVWVAFARMRRSRHGDDDGDVVDGRIEREKSSDARLDRVIRAVIDARTIGGDSDDVRFVVDDDDDFDDAARSRRPSDDDEKDEENHHPTPPTPTPKPRGKNNNNNNNSSFFTIDASTGLGVRRVVLALVRAIHPSIISIHRNPRRSTSYRLNNTRHTHIMIQNPTY